MIIELLGTSKNITREKINEEKKFKYYAGLQLLIDSTFHFLKLNDINQIYNYTGKILSQNIPGSLIILSRINENDEIIPARIFGISEPSLKKETEHMLQIGENHGCKLNPKVLKLLSQKFIIEFKNGFEEFTGKMPGNQFCEKVKDLYPDYRMFAMGLGDVTRVSESVSIILKDNEELKNKEFIEAFISLASIIIDKKKLEIELRKTNETKDKFFSIISHDLKNPFNTFIGFSGLIIQNIEKIEKQKILDFAKLIHDAALHSHEMMQNLFEWVRSQKKELVAKPSSFDVIGLIHSNIKLFSSEAVKKEIRINFKPEQEINLYTDIDIINTIFRNLISNALKFTNKGGEITISYQLGDNKIIFKVKDNGIGIPKENLKTLFSLKTSKSTTGTFNEKGTGLGLLLCREFVQLIGGTMHVESEEGKGSEFSFSLPMKN
jgi:signal transduction histidine kinase